MDMFKGAFAFLNAYLRDCSSFNKKMCRFCTLDYIFGARFFPCLFLSTVFVAALLPFIRIQYLFLVVNAKCVVTGIQNAILWFWQHA